MHKIHANMYFLYVELMSFFIQLGNLFKLYSFFYNIPKSYMNTKHTKFYHIIHIIVPFNSDTNAMYQFVIIFFSSLKRPQISFKSSPFISFVQFLELRVIPHPIKILLAKGETRKSEFIPIKCYFFRWRVYPPLVFSFHFLFSNLTFSLRFRIFSIIISIIQRFNEKFPQLTLTKSLEKLF